MSGLMVATLVTCFLGHSQAQALQTRFSTERDLLLPLLAQLASSKAPALRWSIRGEGRVMILLRGGPAPCLRVLSLHPSCWPCFL